MVTHTWSKHLCLTTFHLNIQFLHTVLTIFLSATGIYDVFGGSCTFHHNKQFGFYDCFGVVRVVIIDENLL